MGKTIMENRTMGILLFVGLIAQFVFPRIMLGSISWISTVLYLFVALILFIS